jgi:hypothetical protein
VLGYAITGRALGVLINEDKCMSLSRFQMVLWTVIVISGYFVIAIARVKEGDVAAPLAVQIDWQVWALLGISGVSLVGSPIVRSTKEWKKPAQHVAEKAGKPYGDNAEKVNTLRRGLIYPNEDISQARWTDMFEGEELGNASLVDLGKVQMFFFTIIVALAYCAELYDLIAVRDLTEDKLAMPTLHEGLLTLMGISNAAYLGAKGAPQTPTAHNN